MSIATESSEARHSPCQFLLRDPTTRIAVLTHLVDLISQSDERRLADLVRGGLSPASIEQLRRLSLADAWHFAEGPCGLSIHIEPRQIQLQLLRLEHAKLDREMLEYFVRNGASPALLAQLFRRSQQDVRHMRKVLAPAIAVGGRPRSPDEPDRSCIEAAWTVLCRDEASERQRFFRLHQDFTQYQIASLETVVRPSGVRTPGRPQNQAAPAAKACGLPTAGHFAANAAVHDPRRADAA